MAKAMAVAAHISRAFPTRHLSGEQFIGLGARLKAALGSKLHCFESPEWTLDKCWAYKFLQANPDLLPTDINPPTDRYAEPKHAAISNIVLLQRYEWLALAAKLHPDVDVFAWIEYTVLKQRNVTEQVVIDFMKAIETKSYDAISLPGIWEKKPIDDRFAHWRFAGSVAVVPRKYVEKFAQAFKAVATLRTEMTGRISWDMNTTAFLELMEILPIRWYPGNHDETQFTNY